MKSVGIIGGIGPESTIEYYRQIIAAYREQTQGRSPSIVINSIDVRKLLSLIEANQLDRVVEYLSAEVGRLARAGADLGLLAANTPHIVFDEVQARSPIPLLSIVQATCDVVKGQGFKSVGLFGTRFTMQAGFYQRAFGKQGIAVVLPELDEQNYIHDKYTNELLNNRFLPETRDGILAIADRLHQVHGVQAVILGGTELPLLLRDMRDGSTAFLDTTRIHVKAVVRELLSAPL